MKISKDKLTKYLVREFKEDLKNKDLSPDKRKALEEFINRYCSLTIK